MIKNVTDAAQAADKEVMECKDNIVGDLCKNLHSDNPITTQRLLFLKLNNLLAKNEKSCTYSENLYNKDISHGNGKGIYISKRRTRGFYSAREAHLFDVLYDFFDGKVSDEKLLFIIDLLKNYDKDE